MLVALIRAMKPKMLDSFKDYNAQKEFLAKLGKNKKITVILNDKKNIVQQLQSDIVNQCINHNKKIIVYKMSNNIYIKN